MKLSPLFSKAIRSGKIKVWVLAPSVITADDNIHYYYDFSQSIEEYTRVFASLQWEWIWQPVNMETYGQVISEIVEERNSGKHLPVILNLCDGDEVNGTPGISVVKLLCANDLIYTGADEYFYEVTTSKIPMKKAFDKYAVPTAPWIGISNSLINTSEIINVTGTPLIIKPAVSGGSMGVGVRNVVETAAELQNITAEMFEGYRGWNLTSDGLLAERFITGPEYTVFISGSWDHPENAVIHLPVERTFHASLPEKEKFLSFDRLWEIYEDEKPMPGEENFYEYVTPDPMLIPSLKEISWDAYCACKGKGYTRVDIRMDADTKKLYVLEVNAQCGISEDENFTSIGAVLRLEQSSFKDLLLEIFNDAFIRSAINKQLFVSARNKARA